ncbi:uncharacterized protein [Watersipora subatra]|uniref:uncharacterized protein n=1 Tax=Watersipora subatra TaxID=2589382 RepID=UPI00355C9828
MHFLTLAIFSCVCVAFTLSVKDNQCCVNQPAPVTRVEKTGVQTRYRQGTASESYSDKCGTWGWRRCTRYRGKTVAQSYRYDIYQKKSYPQPCKKYACCHGYTMVKNVCYANSELSQVVGHVGDIKDSLSGLGDVDLKDVLGTVNDVVNG